jgi:hypothetical protein
VSWTVPPPLFSCKTPAGRRLNRPVPVPGGQPDPTTGAEPVPAARWARCPVDGQLHLLATADVAAVTAGDAYAALCGRWIPVGELTLRGSSQGLRRRLCAPVPPEGVRVGGRGPSGGIPGSAPPSQRCSTRKAGTMAKHRLADRRARARVPIPAHMVDMVDLGTGTSHLLTPTPPSLPRAVRAGRAARGAGRSGNGLLLGLPIQHPGSEVEVTRR